MTGAAHRGDPAPEGVEEAAHRTVGQVEGYLLWQARVAEAERRARAFTEPLHWLTGAQREEVERHYVRECLIRARADLQRVADRSRSLRGEYEDRYRHLRVRCVALLIAGVSLAGVATVGAALVSARL
ncbi:cytochrome C oxidase subunit I [Streptomyces tropicalis]|uniref:Cytochrome C oxidase subunit I n=1 Tax=Streptomyces tropicalis TaxID=3034234 RepID=A0ABT6A397_9ACTN|nr:cytochrome C oxidase subunit I [Streptomyces tropicalis]MDF3299112.1 cytochrome C oxidase subunit I [Streptomyces tropicalis]